MRINTISKMGWFDIIEYVLLSSIVIVNSVTLVLLKRRKHSVRIKNQINIIAALCLNGIASVPITFLFYVMKYNEIEGNMSTIFKKMFLCMSDIFVMLNYYFIMILLTIDQFLVFYLNMKYQVYLPPKKVIKVITFVTLSLFVGTVTVLALVLLKKMSIKYHWNMLYVSYAIIDIGYIILVIFVYAYIFNVYKRQLEIKKTHIRNNERFKLLIPSLIVATFIIFNIVPDFFLTAVKYNVIQVSKTVKEIPFMFYRLGRMADAFIYIFNFSLKR